MNHYKRDKTEPFWWGLFAAGGMVAALLIPMHLFINGLAPHLGLAGAEVNGYEAMRELISHPLAKLYFLIMIVMPLYHAAHRIRFTIYELGVRVPGLSILCYGGALVGTGLAAYIFFHLLP